MPKKKAARPPTRAAVPRGARKRTKKDGGILKQPSARDFSIANDVLRGASYREAGERHGISGQQAWTITQRVEEWERQQQIDDRLKMKRDSTRRLRRNMWVLSNVLDVKFDLMELAIAANNVEAITAIELDVGAMKELRETDKALRELWGVGPATVPDEQQHIEPSSQTDEEFEASIEAARQQRDRRIRMKAKMAAAKKKGATDAV